ncbi:hypothetical protein M0812_25724 [Anaeramoeba flamelloides]|uniref:Uncharacterized protein n=1 Tax=Anaeramoeba flamelloides TaxID=1746091 RepID=A0AAV7YHL3_9EUKA|nr:hypothetical protein M0812_25724 [Anaeramoeba flamelloides]
MFSSLFTRFQTKTSPHTVQPRFVSIDNPRLLDSVFGFEGYKKNSIFEKRLLVKRIKEIEKKKREYKQINLTDLEISVEKPQLQISKLGFVGLISTILGNPLINYISYELVLQKHRYLYPNVEHNRRMNFSKTIQYLSNVVLIGSGKLALQYNYALAIDQEDVFPKFLKVCSLYAASLYSLFDIPFVNRNSELWPIAGSIQSLVEISLFYVSILRNIVKKITNRKRNKSAEKRINVEFSNMISKSNKKTIKKEYPAERFLTVPFW